MCYYGCMLHYRALEKLCWMGLIWLKEARFLFVLFCFLLATKTLSVTVNQPQHLNKKGQLCMEFTYLFRYTTIHPSTYTWFFKCVQKEEISWVLSIQPFCVWRVLTPFSKVFGTFGIQLSFCALLLPLSATYIHLKKNIFQYLNIIRYHVCIMYQFMIFHPFMYQKLLLHVA